MPGGRGHLEALRHDTDDGVRLAVDPYGALQDIRVGFEAALPQGMTQDHDSRVPLLFVRRDDPPAHEGLDLEEIPDATRGEQPVQSFGLSIPREVVLSAPEGTHLFEGGVL